MTTGTAVLPFGIMVPDTTAAVREVYDHPSAMEPLLPEKAVALEELAFELTQHSAGLGSAIHPITRSAVVEVVRSMNSYYSNLIEGHNTHPLDIERALEKQYSNDPSKRALQLESKAHIEVQRLIEAKLEVHPETEICSADFICWIHREFYHRLPEEFRVVETRGGGRDIVHPGELRKCEVEVHRHIPPLSKNLPRFLLRFGEAYEPSRLPPMQRIIAAAASHHRLAWIHPFLDGNGRVTRLFTHAYLIKTKIDGHGLWMVSRGFSKFKDGYMSALSLADSARQGDFDGRGNLSTKELENFCSFFLLTAIDQVKFMAGLLELDSMHGRLVDFAAYWCRETRQSFLRSLSEPMGHLFSDLFLRGELTRGEATAILSIPERTAREVLKRLLSEKLIASGGPRLPIRLGFPTFVTGFYFPKLYPDSVALGLKLPNADERAFTFGIE